MNTPFKIAAKEIVNPECTVRRYGEEIQVVTPCGILHVSPENPGHAERMLYALADTLLRSLGQ